MSDRGPGEQRVKDPGWEVGTGTGTALGVGLGTVVFAITDDAAWIAWGAAGGLVIGAIVGLLRRPSGTREDDQ